MRLFQVELEHYEKIEGTTLSLDGKANRLAALIRGNLGMAMQGLAVVPLFAGYDLDRGRRAGSSPTTSPAAATRRPASTRSAPARCSPAASLKKLYRDGPHRRRVRDRPSSQALYDAADDDSATGGPDLTRRIFPVVPRDHRATAAAGCPTTRSPRSPTA